MASPEARDGGFRCVLVAVRHAALSAGIRTLLGSVAATVAQVADEESLLEVAVRLRPEVAVVELELPLRDGLGMVRRLRRACPDLEVVVLSEHELPTPTRERVASEVGALVPFEKICSELLPALDALLAARLKPVGAA